tara:strand:+ start:5051 stop:6925 length:1875 start_codon:yes stop_codon:yes gene_type:complete
MAVKSSQINVTDLDFDNISDNLKNYLKGQTIFKDYNFEGATLSILIDLLAYASHVGAVNTNIAASELFLDSAQIRKNVVSRAKDLGFVPSSEKASTATATMQLRNVKGADGIIPELTSMIMPRGTIFTTTYEGTNYEFVTAETYTPSIDNTTFTYTDIELVQGTFAQDQYVFDSQIANSKFVLSNSRVDKLRMTVTVNSGGTSSTYSLSTDISNITTTSKVYYTQENEEGFIEIYFGDGTLGTKLLDGDIITVDYIIVDDIHADGANRFQQTTAINGYSDSSIVVSAKATGGAEKESIESIKFKATKFYTSQNRLVTLNDYKAKVQEYYPNADAVAVWGGEDNDPPAYGKVFIALKPNNADYLSDTEKSLVKTNLNKLNMLTVRPEIVDADIIKILISTTFKYNPNLTTLTAGELATLVKGTINQFDTDELNGFDAIFRHSNLLKTIDASDSSILSNTTNIRLKKKLKGTVSTTPKGYTVSMGNPLYNPHSGHNAMSGGIITTTGFKVGGDSVNTYYFDDDGAGNVRRYYLSGATRVYKDNAAGVVNYATGLVTINAFILTSTVNTDTSIDFTVIPSGNDVVAERGNLIDISSDDISVTGQVDTIASGESSAGIGFETTSTSSY